FVGVFFGGSAALGAGAVGFVVAGLLAEAAGFAGGGPGSGGFFSGFVDRFGSRSFAAGSISSSSLRINGPYGLRCISIPNWCSCEPTSAPLLLGPVRSSPGTTP